MISTDPNLHSSYPSNQAGSNPCSTRTIALLPWGHVWEDFYDSIHVSFESFCQNMTGGWQFGYVEALRRVGIQTVMIYPSTRVQQPSRFLHSPTGATICLLPVSKHYLAIRQQMVTPYPSFARDVETLFGAVQGGRRVMFNLLKDIAPYLTTPLRLLAQELRRSQCSAILCQEYEYFRFDVCTLLGRFMQLPVFATFQGTTSDNNRIGYRVRSRMIKACSGLIIAPQTEIQRVQTRYALPPERVAQIFNPIDLQMWEQGDRQAARIKLNIPAQAQVVVWHGRVELHIKGLDLLLAAWERLNQHRSPDQLRLLLMGTGKDASVLRQRIASLPIQNVIWVEEYVNDRTLIQQFLAAGDIYAFPSRHEGFPVAPLEAMACHLPVVAADAPGIPDIFADGETSGGIVVPREDVMALETALDRLLNDPVLRQTLGQAARSRVETAFSLEVVGQQLAHFIGASSSGYRFTPTSLSSKQLKGDPQC